MEKDMCRCGLCGKAIDAFRASVDAIDEPLCDKCFQVVSKWPSQRADQPPQGFSAKENQ